MKFPHTPAPWHNGWGKVIDAEGKAICMVTYRKNSNNGDLLAAAPDLLAALQAIVHRIDPQGDEAPESARCRVCGEHPGSHAADCPVTIARAAIAKAKGENA
jgi:hypothetical protein